MQVDGRVRSPRETNEQYIHILRIIPGEPIVHDGGECGQAPPSARARTQYTMMTLSKQAMLHAGSEHNATLVDADANESTNAQRLRRGRRRGRGREYRGAPRTTATPRPRAIRGDQWSRSTSLTMSTFTNSSRLAMSSSSWMNGALSTMRSRGTSAAARSRTTPCRRK